MLIATLGVEPQVVTLALDLLRRAQPISHAVVVHTRADVEPIGSALRRLRAEVPFYATAPRTAFRFVVIGDDSGHRPDDILTEADARAVLLTIYREVLHAKQEGRRVHLSIAGGRKVMSAYGTAVAQLLFDDNDCCWHLLSEGPLLRDKRMHAAPGDQVVLVPVPILQWSSIPPVATVLAKSQDPWQALASQQALRRQEDRNLKRAFVERELTPAERKIVHLLAREGLSNAALARRLHLSASTVGNQLTAIYAKYHQFRAYAAGVKVDRGVLIAELSPVLDETADDTGTREE